MTSRRRWLYPFLFSVVPVVHFAGANPDQYRFGDLVLLAGLGLLICAVVYGAVMLAVGRRGPPGLAPFITAMAMGWWYSYNILVGKLSTKGELNHAAVIAGIVVVSAAVIFWVRRREGFLEGAGRYLTLVGLLLVGWSGVQIVLGLARGHWAIERSELAGELARPIEGPLAVPEPRRSIYLIVVDEYANSQVLRERFGYDNSPFEDSLRALGFHVPKLVRSNYAHTLLSLPSLLNAAHLNGLEQELGDDTKHPALPNHLLDHNRVARYLERRGYRFVFFPSQWWYSTSESSLADAQFKAWRGFDLSRSLSGGELGRAVRSTSPLRFLDGDHGWEAEHVRRTLRAMSALPQSRGPLFAFAHVVKPHSPYVFDRDCNTLDRGPETDNVGPYLAQIECVNQLLLTTVRRILESSAVPPIIILQGDHGTKLMHATGYNDVSKVPPQAARERVGAFGAYYLPDGGARVFGDTVTVVNVLGNVLRYYFRAHLPRAGDEQYISTADFPYAFRRVDARWLAGDDSGKHATRGGS